MKYFSCIAEPLLVSQNAGPDLHTPIYLLSIPPSLHLKLAFNNILTDLMKVWPDLTVFLKSKHIPVEAYHGGGHKVVLEGNQVLHGSDTLKPNFVFRLILYLDAWRNFISWFPTSCSST